MFNYKSDNLLELIKQCRDSFIVIDNADILIDDEIRRFINFEFSNQYMLFFDNALVIESKESNQDIRNKYRILKLMTEKSEGKIIIFDMICFEHLILAFDKLVEWTGTGKTDKIKIRHHW